MAIESLRPSWRSYGAREHSEPIDWPFLVGSSPEVRSVVQQIDRVSRSDAPVLIQGETGSGKELAARAIRIRSERRDGPFVPVNCGSIPDGLIETELFGNAAGAFTDARQARDGMVAHAHRGTLFLDEIDALTPKAQVALLRFLQDFRYRPVGIAREVFADVRIIAATNQRLQTLVAEGRFRSDLLFRLNILELTIPPLRSRQTDIDLLAQHFLSVFCRKYALPIKTLHPDTLLWLRRQPWPGNVRELENWVHRQVLLGDDREIRLDEHESSGSGEPTPAFDDPTLDFRAAKARAIAEFERTYITRILGAARGNVTAAARLAGKERRAFGKLLAKYGIDRIHFNS
jgi:DNA-binding NtrC family response regulator